MLRSYGNILQLGRIRQRQVRVPKRLVALPGNQVEAVPLVQPVQPEHGSDTLHFRRDEWTDLPPCGPRHLRERG